MKYLMGKSVSAAQAHTAYRLNTICQNERYHTQDISHSPVWFPW